MSAATGEVRTLIAELDETLAAHYTAEQRHGLDVDALFAPNVRFFLARSGPAAVGCGGIALFETFGEVKRMYVRADSRGHGVAHALLARIEREARGCGLPLLRLETGTQQHAAIRLYERAGFLPCAPFGDYARMTETAIATSVFLEKRLDRP